MTPDPTRLSAGAGMQRPGRAAWLLASPLVAWLLLFVAAPTAILLVYSFFRGVGLNEVKIDLTLTNYARVVHPAYLRIFARSIRYAGGTTALCIAIGYPVAYRIGRASERNRGRLLLLVMIPFWTSFLIRTYAWFIILQREGLLNGMLESLQIIPRMIAAPTELLYSPTAVMITLVYTYLPFMILPIYGSVEKLDNSLLEAAADLGAGPIRAFCA